ncbi:hypothetical protein [Devosia nitrariae]|uniref:Uncharacterized protein n=1 Tax=Devosia nitrariae TaxID=2071872 RepID=A0ABQ5W9F8_9HYPH|nr:hypothetical protein [Devosia nitrariae]GLQ56565.1 hypothetical protein GCM10010862_38240 [Devosia nitrariae]
MRGRLDYSFRAANVDLGARLHITPAKSPTARARHERLYRTLHDMLISRYSGRSFENVVVKGDYDSEANAVLDYEELGRAIVRFIVDVYHLAPARRSAGCDALRHVAGAPEEVSRPASAG